MLFDIPWQIREKHDNDIREILNSLGFTDSQNRIRMWDGKKIQNYIGLTHEHSSIDICNCHCKEKARERK